MAEWQNRPLDAF
jgi:transposase-like protein